MYGRDARHLCMVETQGHNQTNRLPLGINILSNCHYRVSAMIGDLVISLSAVLLAFFCKFGLFLALVICAF
jgi:hypothetical protein